MGAPINKAPNYIKSMFDDKFVDDVFLIKEFAFDAVILKEILLEKFEKSSCEIEFNTTVKSVEKSGDDIVVNLKNDQKVKAKFVFNCTYSGFNNILKSSNLPLLNLKHEITERKLDR